MLVIDGYNLLFAVVPGAGDRIPSSREELLDLLAAYCGKNDIRARVIFDSSKAGEIFQYGRRMRRGNLEIVFTRRGQSADTAIIELVGETKDKKSITVVSTDHEIVQAAETARIASLRSEDFGKKLSEFLNQSKSVYDERKMKGISPQEADYWMKEFGLSEEE